MFNYSDVLNISPFSLDKNAKEKMMFENLLDLTKFHFENCEISEVPQNRYYDNSEEEDSTSTMGLKES